MSKYQAQDFTTETGEQDILKVDWDHDVTVIIQGTAGSDDIDLEITLDSPDKASVERFKLAINVLATDALYIKTLEGPVSGIGIDIDSNSNNGIKVRVLSSHRGG